MEKGWIEFFISFDPPHRGIRSLVVRPLKKLCVFLYIWLFTRLPYFEQWATNSCLSDLCIWMFFYCPPNCKSAIKHFYAFKFRLGEARRKIMWTNLRHMGVLIIFSCLKYIMSAMSERAARGWCEGSEATFITSKSLKWVREAAKKYSSTNGQAIKRGGGGAGPLRKK